MTPTTRAPYYPDPPRKTLRRAIDQWVRDGMSADQFDQFRDLMNKVEAEARQQERERLIALVEALPTLIGWVKWDEALVPTAPPYVARSAVLSILRGEDS